MLEQRPLVTVKLIAKELFDDSVSRRWLKCVVVGRGLRQRSGFVWLEFLERLGGVV